MRSNGKISPIHDTSDSGSDQISNHDEKFKATMIENAEPVDLSSVKEENEKSKQEKQKPSRKLKPFEIVSSHYFVVHPLYLVFNVIPFYSIDTLTVGIFY